MVGPWPLAPHHDPLQFIHHIHLMQRGQNRGVTENMRRNTMILRETMSGMTTTAEANSIKTATLLLLLIVRLETCASLQAIPKRQSAV